MTVCVVIQAGMCMCGNSVCIHMCTYIYVHTYVFIRISVWNAHMRPTPVSFIPAINRDGVGMCNAQSIHCRLCCSWAELMYF